MQIDILIQAISQHAWGVVTGCVLLLIVYAAKLPAIAVQWQRLPAWSRPIVPVALGIVSGVGEALTTRASWTAALIVQVIAAMPALAVALPSPVVRTGTEAVSVPVPEKPKPKPMTADELADAVLKSLDRDTTPTDPPGG